MGIFVLYIWRAAQQSSSLDVGNTMSSLHLYLSYAGHQNTNGNICTVIETYAGWPTKTEQSMQSIFQDFALINSYLFSTCWIEHHFLIILAPRSSNLVENSLFYE